MADDVNITVRLRGAREASRDADRVAKSVKNVGASSTSVVAPMGRATKATDKLSTSSLRATSSGKRLSLSLATFARGGAAAGAIAGVYGLGKGIKYIATAGDEAARISAATTQRIKATGGAAKVSAKHVADLAGALSLKTGVDDEQIQAGANLLLTFKNVRNEAGKANKIFDQATTTAVDMAAAYDLSAKSANTMLGKALQDPAKGAAALKKVGAISAAEVEKIQKMAENGTKRLDLQKFLLKSINNSGVKGAAAAQSQPIDRIRNAFENMAESIDSKVRPVVNRALKQVAGFMEGVLSGKGAGGRFAAGAKKMFDDLVRAVRPLGPVLKNDVLPALRWLAPLIAKAFVMYLKVAIVRIGATVRAIVWLMKASKNTVRGVVSAFTSMVSFFRGIPGKISSVFTGAFDGLKSAFASALRFIIDGINSLPHIKTPFGDIGIPHVNYPKSAISPARSKQLPGMATGGLVRGGGAALIGERGPELLSFPKGARVDPLPQGAVNVHSTIMLDGREVARSTARHVSAARNRR